MKAKFTMLLLAIAVGAFAVAGCGSDNNNDNNSDTGSSAPATSETATQPTDTTDTSASGGSSGGGGGETLKLSADPSGALKFDKTELSAKAGKVSIVMENPSPVPHAVSIEGNGVDEEGKPASVGQGEKSTAGPVDLKAGTYTFYCPVDGHEAAGMKGTLTVK
jgi:uncharacterized cupredoxin-like copper-binding protein